MTGSLHGPIHVDQTCTCTT